MIDKNGGEEVVFSPSARMILFSVHKARNLSDDEACDKAGIDRQLPSRWATKYGSYYTDWLSEACDQDTSDDAAVLERVGMVNALQGNFQFWREMAKTKGVIKEEQPKAGLTLNTDFTVILQASGGNLEAARAQLMEELRGIKRPATMPAVIERSPETPKPVPVMAHYEVFDEELEEMK